MKKEKERDNKTHKYLIIDLQNKGSLTRGYNLGWR
jgi:hypothetical protein